MKFLSYFSMIVFCLGFSLMSCGGDSEAKQAAKDALGDVTAPLVDPATTQTPPPPKTPEPPQNAEGVWHYTCPSGCAGGGGVAGPCATCGATLAHNTAYHNSGDAAAAPAITPPGATAGDPSAAVPPPAAAKTPEPPQNEKGVWHYTCGKGCPGGAGTAGQCATCGGALAHNVEYHN